MQFERVSVRARIAKIGSKPNISGTFIFIMTNAKKYELPPFAEWVQRWEHLIGDYMEDGRLITMEVLELRYKWENKEIDWLTYINLVANPN